jgi:hypothetical protein
MIKQLKKPKYKLKQDNPLIGKILIKLFLWFLSSFYPNRLAVYSKWFTEWTNVINKQANCRGKRETLSYCKLVRLSVTRYLSGEPLPKETPKIKLSKDGLPNVIYFLHPIIREKKIDDLRIIFTMLNLTRGVILEPVNNFDSITNTWEGKLPINWYTFRSAIKYHLNIRRSKYTFEATHTSTKTGPNGQAMLFSIHDLLALPESLKNSLVALGGNKILDIFTKLNEPIKDVPTYQHWFKLMDFKEQNSLKFRKLSTFGDKEGKTRVIGILDYWSQTVLKPIHKVLEGILRRIPEDCTFDQSAWYTKLPLKCTYYSFDLTNATDRLPVKQQKDIIELIFGHKVANAWEDILVNYCFPHKVTSREVKYSTGQPMGAYSSWPIMSLQHHFLVVYAAFLAGVNPRGKYVLLGDDIVIADDQIAEKYQSVLRELDVPISMMKTHKSKDICEFAKRWYFQGHEITAFPLHSIKNNLKRYYLLQNSIEDGRKKGYILSESVERECLIKLIQLTGKKEQALRIYKLYKLFDAIVDPRKSLDDDKEYLGNIRNVLLANWKIPKENLDKFDEGNFKENIEFQLEEYFLDLTSDGNNEMMEIMDARKKWVKAAKAIDPLLWENLKSTIPIIIAFDTCWSERTKILDKYYKEFANDKNKLRASLKILGSLPTISMRVVNTRSAHQVLAAHSRLVKMLLEAFVKFTPPPMTDEDWMSQMTTIQSVNGDEAE